MSVPKAAPPRRRDFRPRSRVKTHAAARAPKNHAPENAKEAMRHLLPLRLRALIACLSLAMVGIGLGAAAPALAAVPSGFVGVNADGPLLQSDYGPNLYGAFQTMASSGVQTVRVPFNWAQAQPYRPGSPVPDGWQKVDGVPTNFAYTDELVYYAAIHGLRLLPIVIYTPGWDAGTNRRGMAPPRDDSRYADYVAALVHRYGPRGTYWSQVSPRVPIRQWQIWNEPNLWYYWPQPFAASYVRLLAAAHAAIVRADPGATTVLGALTNYSWTDLGKLYAVRGARWDFNEMAANTFTTQPSGVITILRYVRSVMAAHGDSGKPLTVTEFGWTSELSSGHHHLPWDETLSGQATKDTQAMNLLAANRRSLHLTAFYIYTWVGNQTWGGQDWNWAGLFRVSPTTRQVSAKPAYYAFTRTAQALER